MSGRLWNYNLDTEDLDTLLSNEKEFDRQTSLNTAVEILYLSSGDDQDWSLGRSPVGLFSLQGLRSSLQTPSPEPEERGGREGSTRVVPVSSRSTEDILLLRTYTQRSVLGQRVVL